MRATLSNTNAEAIRMCLLCEELWMPFELPPEAKARTFVADSPEPDDGPTATPPTSASPAENGDPPASPE
jgi:hypothetical protein